MGEKMASIIVWMLFCSVLYYLDAIYCLERSVTIPQGCSVLVVFDALVTHGLGAGFNNHLDAVLSGAQ